MTEFGFRSPSGEAISAAQWVAIWSAKFDSTIYPEDIYRELVATGLELSDAEFEIVGAWKEGAIRSVRLGMTFGNCSVKFTDKWKPGTVAAYGVWRSLPDCRSALEQYLLRGQHRLFLDHLSQKSFMKPCKGGGVTSTKFGLSRSTFVLHILSRARFPIYDSNTQAGIHLLTQGQIVKTKTAAIDGDWYLRMFCTIIHDLQGACSASDLQSQRTLDKALFCYGKVAKKRRS